MKNGLPITYTSNQTQSENQEALENVLFHLLKLAGQSDTTNLK